MTVRNTIAACFALLFVALVPAQTSRWSVERYTSLDAAAFMDLPEVNEEIDFDAVDYPLLDAAVFYLSNAQRTERGLLPLTHSVQLERAASEHSIAMRDRGFFSHTSPISGRRSVQDRTVAAGFANPAVGENIARSFGIRYEAGRSVFTPPQNGGYFSYQIRGEPIPPHTYRSAAEAVVTQWMNSPGHRANILRREYRFLGVGAAHFEDASFFGIDTFMFTQNFGR